MENSSSEARAILNHRKRRRISVNLDDTPREVGHMRNQESGSATFVGSGSGVHFVRTVRQTFSRHILNQSLVNEGLHDELVPGEEDLGGSWTTSTSLWHEDEVLHTGVQSHFTFDDLVLWTRSYFDAWHPLFPFLHAPTILETLEKMSTTGLESLEYPERVITSSIMSIALADRRQLPLREGLGLVPFDLVYQTVDEALSVMQPLLLRPASLLILQAFISIQLFLISMLRLNAASRVGGLIVRMAYHLGLHRCPTRFKQFSIAEADIRRRIFWTIYSLERYLSQSLGMPLDLRDDDLDVCYPDHEFHEMLDNPKASDPEFLLLPCLLAKHGKIKGLILEIRNKSILHSRTDPIKAAHIDAEIVRWWNEAQNLIEKDILDDDPWLSCHPPGYEPSTVESTSKPTLKSSHRLLLTVQKHESVILLYRPVLTSGYNTSEFAGAMQKCIEASKQIISQTFQHLRDEIRISGAQGGRIDSPLVWPGFVWTVWQSGIILLYAAAVGDYSVDVAQREAIRCVKILEHISLRGSSWPTACAEAIEDLRQALATHLTESNRSRAPLSQNGEKRLGTNLPRESENSFSEQNRNRGFSTASSISSPVHGSVIHNQSPYTASIDSQSDQHIPNSATQFQQNNSLHNGTNLTSPAPALTQNDRRTVPELRSQGRTPMPSSTPVFSDQRFSNYATANHFDFLQDNDYCFAGTGEEANELDDILQLTDMSCFMRD